MKRNCLMNIYCGRQDIYKGGALAYIKNRAARDFRISDGTQRSESLEFSKLKVGKTLLDGDISYLPTPVSSIFDAPLPHKIKYKDVIKALREHNARELRFISNHFYDTSGIYGRLCRYMAYLYRYDYFVTPLVYNKGMQQSKIIKQWYDAVTLLDQSNLKEQFGDIALSVVKNGCYYGYRVQDDNGAYLQELPVDYCRSRYKLAGEPMVELNMKYFDDAFADIAYRTKILKTFDKQIQQAYILYKQQKLPKDFEGDTNGWYLLEPGSAVKFNLSDSDLPIFAPVIPAIMDLDAAKDLDKEKMRQQLLRIIVQEMPIDKNGDMIFDLEETQQLHTNAVEMLGEAIGVNVLTTFADVDSIDMSDKGNMSAADQLEKVERSVYNEAGVSQMQFNTSTNLALEKSIANDEATMTDLLYQFRRYAESLLKKYNQKPKTIRFRVEMLPTTIYNYKDLSKLYKEQTTIGFSKLLPQVALGQSQLVVMSTAYFENEVMQLDKLFVPPQMSSTMSGKDNDSGNKTAVASDSEGGRPPLDDDEKSDKTIANQEAG